VVTIFGQVLQAREQAVAAGIQPNAVRLGAAQWQEVRRSLVDTGWPEAMDFSPTRLNIHGLWVHLALGEADLCEAIVYLEVPA
jgi:hypothetical protein